MNKYIIDLVGAIPDDYTVRLKFTNQNIIIKVSHQDRHIQHDLSFVGCDSCCFDIIRFTIKKTIQDLQEVENEISV